MTTSAAPLTACSLRTAAPAAAGAAAGGSARHLLYLAGELDIDTVGHVEPRLSRFADEPAGELLLDLSGVTFCDSAGVALLVRLYRRCRASGTRLALLDVPRRPARVLRELGVDQLVPCGFQGVPAARAA